MPLDIIRTINSMIYPVFCARCEKEGDWICDSCLNNLDFRGVWLCPVCHFYSAGGMCHVGCRNNCLDGAISIYTYDDQHPVLHLLKNLKYHLAHDTTLVWQDLWAKFWEQHKDMLRPILRESTLIPIPLHPRRERLRGFNQAAILASSLLVALGQDEVRVKYKPNILKRKRHTACQAELKADYVKRMLNMDSAFAVNNTRVSGRVLLVDDVFTSGATLNAAAQALRQAGASHVFAVTLFRG